MEWLSIGGEQEGTKSEMLQSCNAGSIKEELTLADDDGGVVCCEADDLSAIAGREALQTHISPSLLRKQTFGMVGVPEIIRRNSKGQFGGFVGMPTTVHASDLNPKTQAETHPPRGLWFWACKFRALHAIVGAHHMLWVYS